MHYTTSCNTQSSAPEDGQNNFPKHVELTGIINKSLLLHLVGCLYYFYLIIYIFLRLAKQSQFIPLQNVVYFITLPFLVRKIFTFYINNVLQIKCPFPGPKGQFRSTQYDHNWWPLRTTQPVLLMRFIPLPWDTRRLATAGLNSGFTCVRPTRPFLAGAVLFAILTPQSIYLANSRDHVAYTAQPAYRSESLRLSYLPPTPIAVTLQTCSSLVLNIGCAENRIVCRQRYYADTLHGVGLNGRNQNWAA